MSKSRSVAAAILLAACGEEDPVVTIPDFTARSPVVACVRIEAPAAIASIATVQPVDDSTFLVVDDVTPQVVALDGALQVRWSRAIARESIGRLMDAAGVDSLLVIADGGLNRLIGMGPSGEQRWERRLDFPPQRVTYVGDRLLVAAVGADLRLPGLIYEVTAAGVVPLDVPLVRHDDALARMLINSVAIRALDDGSALVAHQLVSTRGWRIDPSGGARRTTVPVPDGAAGRVGFVPPMPLREKDLDEIATPVISMTVDPASGEIFHLTRSGRRVGIHQEKAIVRLAPDFSYVASNRLRINATEIVYLPARPDSVIIADAELGWHRCPVPPPPTRR